MKSGLLLTFSFFIISTSLIAQQKQQNQKAESVVKNLYAQWQLAPEDVSDIILQGQYKDLHNGISHFYFRQRYQGIEIYNGIWGIHLSKDDQVIFNAVNFESNISEKINSTSPRLTAEEAVKVALQLFNARKRMDLVPVKRKGNTYFFQSKKVSDEPILATLNYFPSSKHEITLCWKVFINLQEDPDSWLLQIDARTGNMLKQINQTIHCTFDHYPGVAHELHECTAVPPKVAAHSPLLHAPKDQNMNSRAQYRVFPVPVESPLHGFRKLIPELNTPGSPLGWHDIDGRAGAEFFTTRGNNVYAYFDRDANNIPDSIFMGSDNLIFDFPYNATSDPNNNREAALTQLFYMSNFMHDFSYNYGFTESAGNFQQVNYSGAGQGNDPILAEAMDGSGLNNANFSLSSDGRPSRIQMFLWNRGARNLLRVNSPAILTGLYRAGDAAFGPPITEVPVKGQLAIAKDDSNFPELACAPIINTDEINGKIAVITRGKCTLEEKVSNAEAAGAKAVIIINNREGIIGIGDSPDIEDPSIPAIAISLSNGRLLKKFIDDGVEVSIALPEGPGVLLDGSFDNGIIAHEYAHGITTRLTGGPEVNSCLPNPRIGRLPSEQMGEGWSDFFAMVVSTRENIIAERTKGIASFSSGGEINSQGIRRKIYSVFQDLNDYTYDDIIQSFSVHNVGEIWASMLWDLYWAFSDRYGWSPDLLNGNGGNNMAVQLVMDGLKLQSCQPGFIDARDAILAADRANYDGDNQCLIWEVFARRGLGFSARQGDPTDIKDGQEAFDKPPFCNTVLKITKKALPTIFPGDNVGVSINIENGQSTPITGIVIEDRIPEGAVLRSTSILGGRFISNDGQRLVMEVDNLQPGEGTTLFYSLLTDPTLGSKRLYRDDLDDPDPNWQVSSLEGSEEDSWRIVIDTLRNAEVSWMIPATRRANEHILELARDLLIEGEHPVLRCRHRYSTEPRYDGGIVEISEDGGNSWQAVRSNNFIRNTYRGEMAFSTTLLDEQQGFWGLANQSIESFIDLSQYNGQKIRFRFHFYTDDEPDTDAFTEGQGWAIDFVELLDLFSYNTPACFSTDQGDLRCSMLSDVGIAVEALDNQVTNTEDIEPNDALKVNIYPNPVGNQFQVGLEPIQVSGAVHLRLFSPEGKKLLEQSTEVFEGQQQMISMDVSQIPSGIFLLQVQTNSQLISKRIVKQ